MRSGTRRTILLTGASGVVGRAVADELREHRVIGLVHDDTDVPQVEQVLTSDLTQPRLGLSPMRWEALAEEIDVVVHSGALTLWGEPRARYQAINVEGTGRVVELAQRAGAPVHLISTCVVHALENVSYDELSAGNVVKPYIWSKREAERLLAASGVPYTIFRPTNLVGSSVTGASSKPQIVQRISDWVCRGKAPYFVAHPGNRVDVAPLDVLAIAVARAVEADHDFGHTYSVAYGEEAMTNDEALEILVEHARRRGREIAYPAVADPTHPLPIPLEQVPAMSRAFVSVLMDVSEINHACGGVLPSSLPELRTRYGVPDVSDADAFRRSLEYWSADRQATARDAA